MKIHSRSAVLLSILAAVTTASCDLSPKATSTGPAAAQSAATPPAVRYEDHIWANEAAPPAGELVNPNAADRHSAAAGETLFTSMNCDGCHGSAGSGWVGPNLADGRWRYGGRDAEVFSSIFYGRPKGMPAYGGLIGSKGVWLLVTYLNSLPRPEAVPTESWSRSAAPSR